MLCIYNIPGEGQASPQREEQEGQIMEPVKVKSQSTTSTTSCRQRHVHVHDKYSDTCERQCKDIQIPRQQPFKEKLLPQVGFEPMTCVLVQ